MTVERTVTERRPVSALASLWRAPAPAVVMTIGPWDETTGFVVPGFESHQLWPGVRLWNSRSLPRADTWVEGACVFGGGIVGSSWAEPPALRRDSQSPTFRESWAMGAHGSAACWVVDRDRRAVQVLPDFFGGCSLFIAALPRGTALSTSLRQLELWCLATGSPLERSAAFQAERILLGNGGLWPASFADVSRVEQGHFVSLQDQDLREVAYAARANMFDPARPLAEVLQSIRSDIVDNVRAISNSAADVRVAHLTGGFDSRLVLGAILSAQAQDRFIFFTSGAVGTVDRNVADGLARHYELTRTPDAGVRSAAPRNIRERFLAPMRAAGGVMGSGPTGRERPVPIVTAGGGYGELLRTFFYNRMSSYSRGVAPRDLVAHLWPSAQSSRICKQSFVDEVAGRLAERMAMAQVAGVPEQFDLDYFYTTVRNRFHIGMNAYLWSSVGTRLDPLYSPHLMSLGMVASAQDRRSNIHGFDLMDSFAPDLRHHPFASSRYDEHALRVRPPRVVELPTSGEIRWQRITTGRSPVAPPLVAVDARQRAALIKRANAMGMNYWQLELIPLARQALRRTLAESEGVSLESIIDMDYIRHLAVGEVRAKSEIRDLYTTLEALLWLTN